MRAALLALTLAACARNGGNPQTVDGGNLQTDGGNADLTPLMMAGACNQLAAAGTWENITPPVTMLHDVPPCPYGGEFVMSPVDSAVLYVGTCNQGIWKSADCGGSWTHINTGQNATALDAGRQWTFLIDPNDADVLYTNSGYNTYVQGNSDPGNGISGLFKSTNGGVDWQMIWPPADPALGAVVQYNFVGHVVMDPTDHQHLLLSFHASCAAPHSDACFAQSHDAGATWEIVDGLPQWNGGEGQSLYFLENGATWLFGSQTNGLWRTTDSGANWTNLNVTQGHAGGQMYRAKNGTFYQGAPDGVARSPDGVTWTISSASSPMLGVTGNGTTLFATRGFPWDPNPSLYQPFWTSPEGDGQTWTQLSSPMLENGGSLAYDAAHQLLYSSNLGAGVWRVVTP